MNTDPLLALRAAADEELGWFWCPEDPAFEIARLSSSSSSSSSSSASADAWIALGEHFWHGHVRPYDRETAAETLLGAAAGRAQFPTPADHRHFLFGLARGLFTLPPPLPNCGQYNPDWYREVLRLSFSPALFARIRPSAAITAQEAVLQYSRAVFWAAVQVPMPPADRAFVHENLVASAAAVHPLFWKTVLQSPVLMPARVVGAALAAPFTHETLFYLRQGGGASSSTFVTRIADYVVLARPPFRAPSIPEATGDGTSIVESPAGPITILEAFAGATATAGEAQSLHQQASSRNVWRVQRGSIATGGSVTGMRNRGTILVARILEAMMPPDHSFFPFSSIYAVLARASELGILHVSEGDVSPGWVAVLAYMLGHIPSFFTEKGKEKQQRQRYHCYRYKLLSLASHCGTAAAASSSLPGAAAIHLLFPPCPADWRTDNAVALWRDAINKFCATRDATPVGLKPAKRKRGETSVDK